MGCLALLRTPGQHHDGVGLRVQKEVGVGLVPEACDGGGVDGDAVGEGPLQLRGHDGYILGLARHIAEGQTYPFQSVLL